MRYGFSLSLDLVRIGAAFVVFISHLAYFRLTGDWFDEIKDTPFPQHAVMAFFVLSGLVIAYVASDRERTLTLFLRARLVRLYSVVLPMIVLVPALDWLGQWWHPSLYEGRWYADEEPYKRVIGSLFFLHQSWWTNIRYFTNGPYWSIAYEFWYYIAFAAIWFLVGVKRWLGLAVALLIAGPKILLLFPVWALGVLVWRFRARIQLSAFMATSLLVAAIVLYGIYAGTGAHAIVEDAGITLLASIGFPTEKLYLSKPWLSHYLIGLMIAAAFVSLYSLSDHLERLLSPVGGIIRWAAGGTFTMYLMHYPLLHTVASILPGDEENPYRILALFLIVLIGIYAIAEVTERRKAAFGRAYDYLARRLCSVSGTIDRAASQRRLN